MQNMVEVVARTETGKNRSLGWATISCRTADDWNVQLMAARKSHILADHLPTHEAARDWLRAYLREPFYPEEVEPFQRVVRYVVELWQEGSWMPFYTQAAPTGYKTRRWAEKIAEEIRDSSVKSPVRVVERLALL